MPSGSAARSRPRPLGPADGEERRMHLPSAPGPNAPPDGRAPAACTIISRNYLSYANVLARSYFEHQPGGRFYLLVVDGLPDGAQAAPGTRLIGPEELGLPSFY